MDILDSQGTWRFWESEDMEMGGGRGAGRREEEEGKRGEGGGGCEEIRMADGQQDTTQRGSTGLALPHTPFFWVAAVKFLTQRTAGSSQAGCAKIIRRRSIRFSTQALSIDKYTWFAYATSSYLHTKTP